MLLKSLVSLLEEIAPPAFAESWDNVGLLMGDANQHIADVLLTIDYTPAVAIEARNLNCDLIIAYHPPIFSALKRITASGSSALIHDAIRRGVAIYSPHTAWDAAPGGTNDFLADAIGLIDVAPLRLSPPVSTHFKLVTFVPEAAVEKVAAALFVAGAGTIGNYSSCSFRSAGVGTFFGQRGSLPAVGKAGQLEVQPEIRLETLVPMSAVAAVIAALRASHPYEKPAFDLNMLAATASTIGHGRVGHLQSPVAVEQFVALVKKELTLDRVLFSGDESRLINRIAICAGAGGELLDAAVAAGADLFLTGELRHHDAIKASNAGLATLCTLHSNCERPSLKRLKSRLELLLADLAGEHQRPKLMLSQKDQDPFSIR